ncbi:UDP-glucose 4-epimerase [Gemmatimonadetes bacterium T265]|nr:UDP-glucose 4-epimerase [Gemmatimonadetes bacterium T265]
MATRALVTGGAGFIGSHVADLCLSNGCEVTVLDNFATGRRENVPSAATLHEASVTDAAARALVRDGNFDVVFHLAAQIDVRKSVTDPVFDATQNVLGSLNVLEGVRDAKANTGRAPRVVFASTGGALYGDFVTPPNVETYAKDPESPYGIAKLSVELYMGYYARQHGLDCVALRYANVYGPRQDPHGEAGVVAIFCDRILDGRAMTTFGDGSQTRDYVFVKDVARANWRAATIALPPVGPLDARAFNIGTGIETSVNDLAQQLKAAAGSETPVEHAPARAGEIQRSALVIDKARDVLGWTPQVALHDGLRETFEFFAARRAAPATAAA